MSSNFATGNAVADGAPFRQWFVGPLSEWSGAEDCSPVASSFGPRHSRAVEVRWAFHVCGEERPLGWTSPDDTVTLSILVSGRFTLLFRPNDQAPPAAHLRESGDYALWRGSIQHSWRADEDSVVISVRWREASGNEA